MNLLKNSSISFIIPIYNTDSNSYLNCIDSILKQNISNFEIVVVNDGSNNKSTLDAIDRSLILSPNISYYTQSNQGSAAARNNGLSKSKGDFIIFVDADDLIPEKFFDTLELDNLNFDLAIFDYSVVKDKEEVCKSLIHPMDLSKDKESIYKNILYVPGIFEDFMLGAIWAKCFSRSFLTKNNLIFRDELRKTQDRIFMLETCIAAKKIVYVPAFSYRYFLQENSITHKMNFNVIHYCELLINTSRKIITDNKMDQNVSKFFAYGVLGEVLQLTYFHRDFKGNWSEIRKGILDLYKKYNIDKDLKKIKLSEIPSLKSKVRFLLYKYHLIFPLYLYFH